MTTNGFLEHVMNSPEMHYWSAEQVVRASVWDVCNVTGAVAAAGQSEPAGRQQVSDNVSILRGLQADVGYEWWSPQSALCWHRGTWQRPLQGILYGSDLGDFYIRNLVPLMPQICRSVSN